VLMTSVSDDGRMASAPKPLREHAHRRWNELHVKGRGQGSISRTMASPSPNPRCASATNGSLWRDRSKMYGSISRRNADPRVLDDELNMVRFVHHTNANAPHRAACS
jgi:hypothetical protein